MNNRKKISLANRVLILGEKARALYQKKDDFFTQLLVGCRAGEVIETKSGRFEIVDNFAARNVSFRPASFHRYELKEVKTAKLPKKPVVSPAEEAAPPVRAEGPVDQVAAA
ncbi:MAG: hypothetical protein ABJF10_27080 [Chthoniobacter sp.]|uniref:hypothetical protein n=1 Tax=Chthoniobacter sp. TaxID=2510640 RepID=UPI0032A74B60